MSSEINTPDTPAMDTDIFGMKPNTYCMLLHFSQFLVSMFPPFGLAAPIIMWIVAKNKSPQVVLHGKIIANWLISVLIYLAVGFGVFFLELVVVFGYPEVNFVFGILLTILAYIALIGGALVMLLALIFPIIGGMRANQGVAWKYPLSIPFFKVIQSGNCGGVPAS